MNSLVDFEQINFNPFHFFNDQHQDIKDLYLNYFNNLNSNSLIAKTVCLRQEY